MRNVSPKGAIALSALLLVALVGVGGVQSQPVWEPAEEIASASTQTFGRATSVSCVTDDDCVMVGFLGFNPSVAVATEKVDGEWSELAENPRLSPVDLPDWDPAASASLGPVSCLDSGACVAGGALGLTTGGSTGFVTTRTGGTWSAETFPGLVELSTDTGATPNAGVNSVSCDESGTCIAGGLYRYGAASNLFGGWVSTRTGGTWSTAIPVPGLVALNVRDNAQVTKVTGPSGGGCVVIGTYMAEVDGNSRSQAFIAEYAGGTWDDAFPVPGLVAPDGVNQGAASFEGLGCATFDDCAAGGRYWNGSAFQGFVFDKTAGTWGQVTDVPGFAPAANVAIQHIDCPAAGECAMTAQNFSTNTGYLVDQSAGVWQDAEQLLFADGLDGVIDAMRGISCSAPGACAALGIYRTSTSSTFQACQITQSEGVWSEADSVPGMAELLTDPPSRSHGEAVDCVADAGCNFGGVVLFGGTSKVPHRRFAAARATPPPADEPSSDGPSLPATGFMLGGLGVVALGLVGTGAVPSAGAARRRTDATPGD